MRDGQGFGVEFPQFLEQQLALGAGIDEDDRHSRLARMRASTARGAGQAHAAGPGDARARAATWLMWGGAPLGDFDQAGGGTPAPDVIEQRLACARRWPRGRRAGLAGASRRARRERQSAKLVAALGAGERVDFIDDGGGQVGEHRRCPLPDS